MRRGENRRKKKWKRLLWIKIREHISKVVVPYAVPQNTVSCKVPICVALYYMGMCSVHLYVARADTHFYYAICMVQVRRVYTCRWSFPLSKDLLTLISYIVVMSLYRRSWLFIITTAIIIIMWVLAVLFIIFRLLLSYFPFSTTSSSPTNSL